MAAGEPQTAEAASGGGVGRRRRGSRKLIESDCISFYRKQLETDN